MSQKLRYIIPAIICLFTISWAIPFEQEKSNPKAERVKIALRQVGNELLLSNKDSSSIIMPVVQLDPLSYRLSFEGELTFLPDSLVAIVDKNFEKAGLSKNYIVEVIRCQDREVSYSFEMSRNRDKTIVPCIGRKVPNACHTIKVQFIEGTTALSGNKLAIAGLAAGLLVFLIVGFRKTKKGIPNPDLDENQLANEDVHLVGSFHFYPKQNKLVKETEAIALSKKECELLVIFASRPNEIIKREELTKTVWEDHGVIVGRSLDTYISKLRKKLKEDSSIKITNVHGVGYRLEVG
ncbi:winged helix-turn-helix domain-containing protein [Spongiivirga citrea]|uniref:Winged helix family transcriptional regulator n=1 Tax=Spongiivirga citrea TaxID=1481457 RepID=A0A6M0CHR6_9FLAO|nr:winged helix-turn-helix domain-containing protein [Spongiivirga citrea]NER17405.1 winged helix family transcriptional regulator [Spongiivirga citrea]